MRPVMKHQRSNSDGTISKALVNVGRALSFEHAKRMIEHAQINTVMSIAARKKAIGTTSDFPEDAMATYLTQYAEEIFEPKCVLAGTDWLARHREPDQRFTDYRNDQTSKIKWVTHKKNKIYLFAPSL